MGVGLKLGLKTLPAGIALFSSLLALQGGISLLQNEAIPTYPESILFALSASGVARIESVELEFGTDALACGQALTRAIPEDFTPAQSIEVEWEWNLRQAGSLPPGTNIWWRWKMLDAAGSRHETPIQSLTFTDASLRWRRLETNKLVVYWLEGNEEFARRLLDSGQASLTRLEQDTGVELEERVDAYVYPSSEEMQLATLFAPAWSGGLAFPEHKAVLIGIPPADLDWGRRALAHELSHVVIGLYTFSCVNSTPGWLDEGLAMYAEGDMEDYYRVLLAEAVQVGTLQSVRELGEIFSADPERASLAYAQSLSLVDYLIQQHGGEKVLQLLTEFKEGAPEDRALMSVYGVDRDGLESLWRAWIGAAPMQASSETGVQPTHTPYPTLAPIAGPVIQPSATPQESNQSTTDSTALPELEIGGLEPAAEAPSQVLRVLAIVGGLLLLLTAAWLFRRALARRERS